MKNWKDKIREIGPCKDGLNWALSQNSIKDVWDNCERGDWLLWFAFKLNIDKRKLTLAKGYCAKTVLHLMTDQRSKDAVQAAIDYGNGIIDDDQLNTAADAAYAAADAAAAYDYAYAYAYATAADAAAVAAADAAAYAAAAVAADAAAADAAAYAAVAAVAAAADAAAVAAAVAADAAAVAAAYAARKKYLKLTSDICREHLTKEIYKIIELW